MIESISISNVATYPATPTLLNSLSKINYLFGSNGSGKTTISRVIADEKKFHSCTVTWKSGTKLQQLVYNQDFIERNFNQSAELRGVFTLGEEQVDTLSKIEVARVEIEKLTASVEKLNQCLKGMDGSGGKQRELVQLEAALKDKCWAQKQKYDAKLQGGFERFRNNAERFKQKILLEKQVNIAMLPTLADLEKKAENIFGSTPVNEALIAAVDTTRLLTYETNPVLSKRVIGKEDVDIAAMIERLGNSDWVRAGRRFHDANGHICPFCQQETTDIFNLSLIEYFDESFLLDSKAIDDLAKSYATETVRIQQQLAAIITSNSKFVDIDKLKVEKKLLDAKIALNIQKIDDKKKEMSQVVELASLSDVCNSVKALLESANNEAIEHNKVISNLAAERANLTSQIWRFVVEQLKTDLSSYITEKSSLEKAIFALKSRISAEMERKRNKELEIRELEKQKTSVQPTIDGINNLLSSFGFQGFKLAKATNGISYKLVRLNGTDAKATLSEGEKTFITFLYFYHLLKGSDSETGMTTDRVVVFDDPVSSLDSDILFIVSNLIKGLFNDVRNSVGHIKQIFVLTHNVYFHKEVTYSSNRKKCPTNQETFWIVRKSGLVSKIEMHPKNPIKTSYELLWSEVRRPDRSNLSIQNTMRRILENYFKILGGIEFDELCDYFNGKEKLICKSLCSWLHDGSHNAHDDLYVSIDDSMVESYLTVFRAIFEKSKHEAHYKMMMGDAYVENVVMTA